jgi:MerR family transcriptional regulator, light-induced transcriptional regulator
VSNFVSPVQVAQAFGVSESSLKRWCDRGLIRSQRTAGGHRRLAVEDVISYARSSGQRLLRPELLGLPSMRKGSTDALSEEASHLRESLTQGNVEKCCETVLGLYARGHRVSEICDFVIAPACREIGHQWECGEIEVYQERRACELCLQTLNEVSRLVPPASGRAPLAIGGSSEGDPYSLPTRMVELVLREQGWKSQSLGSSLPLETLLAAVNDVKPDLLWISVSFVANREQFLANYRAFYGQVKDRVAVVVGGQALDESLRRQMEYAAHCDNLQHLENFAEILKGSLRPKKRKAAR